MVFWNNGGNKLLFHYINNFIFYFIDTSLKGIKWVFRNRKSEKNRQYKG